MNELKNMSLISYTKWHLVKIIIIIINSRKIYSFDILSRTKSDRAKLSGCSALELSMNSTCSEPLPAIQKIQQFANSQPPTRDSPIIRKVLSVLNIKQLVVDEIDERMKTMHNMRTLPLMIAQQAVTEDVPRNNLSDPDSEKTILLSQYVNFCSTHSISYRWIPFRIEKLMNK